MDPQELPQVREWMAGGRFDPRGFLLATITVAEASVFLDLAWPEFVEYRGCVFLRWAFDPANADTWFDELGDAHAVEGVVNHLHLWDVFSLSVEEEYAATVALAERMRQTWTAALANAFPAREFDVILTNEQDDYGPTLSFRSR